MLSFLFHDIIWKKRAGLLAILWTLLIFFLCLFPGNEIPEMEIPFLDKIVHIVLFAIWSFLWMTYFTEFRIRNFIVVFIGGVLLGWFTEFLQGTLTLLHRNMDVKDILADIVGCALGLLIFYIFYTMHTTSLRNAR